MQISKKNSTVKSCVSTVTLKVYVMYFNYSGNVTHSRSPGTACSKVVRLTSVDS